MLNISKGYLCAILAQKYLYNFEVLILSCSIIGHLFPIWFNFKGDYDISVMLGILLGMDYFLAIIATLLWLIIFRIYKLFFVAYLFSIVFMFMYMIILRFNLFDLMLFLIMETVIFYKYNKNIDNLLTK